MPIMVENFLQSTKVRANFWCNGFYIEKPSNFLSSFSKLNISSNIRKFILQICYTSSLGYNLRFLLRNYIKNHNGLVNLIKSVKKVA